MIDCLADAVATFLPPLLQAEALEASLSIIAYAEDDFKRRALTVIGDGKKGKKGWMCKCIFT